MKKVLSMRQLKSYQKSLNNKKEQIMNSESFHRDEALEQLNPRNMGELSLLRRHPADSGTRSIQQEVELQLAEHEGDELAQIIRALHRIDERSYGYCLSCKESISEKRLMIFPEAEYCYPCKWDQEHELKSRYKPNWDSQASPFNPLIDQVKWKEFS